MVSKIIEILKYKRDLRGMKLLQEEIIRFYLDANKIRENVLELLKNAGSGHLGGSYSEAEILAVLFNKFLKMDPSNPNWTERDRFILSKGHANPGLYAILGELCAFVCEMLVFYDKSGKNCSRYDFNF